MTMNKVIYGGNSFLTTTEVADALIELAATMGHHHDSVAVTVPALTSEGAVTQMRFIVGPASHIISYPETAAVDTIDTADTVHDLAEMTRHVSTSDAVPTNHPIRSGEDEAW